MAKTEGTLVHGALAIIDQNRQNFEGGVVIRLGVNFSYFFCMNILVIPNTKCSPSKLKFGMQANSTNIR